LTAARGLDSVPVLGIDDTPVPTGNELAPDTAAVGETTGQRGVTVVAFHPHPIFVAPSETISTAATRSARLAVLTEPLAGHEFVLDTECCLIGRTADNDIVLDHESVSRAHAKIVRTGDRYVVIDLQSANGVRINGVEHSQVELRPGDMLTLGLVCLRFSGAEGAVADPGIVRRAPPSAARWIVACTAILGVPAAIAIFLAIGNRAPPRVPATAALPVPVIEDFTFVRETAAKPIRVFPIGASLPLGTGWVAAQPSAGRSVKAAGSAAAREFSGRRHSAEAARDIGQSGDLPAAPALGRPWEGDAADYRGPSPRPSPRMTGDREIVPAERERPGKAPRPVQAVPRRQGGDPPHTIDTEDPYPADR
jgi:predicted component of type VI protein secretion system